MTTIPDDIMQAAKACLVEAMTDTRVSDSVKIAWREATTGAMLDAIAHAILAERERCAAVARELQDSADTEFDKRISRGRKGERNLELAAATAAGMSHQARKISKAILKGTP